MDLTKYPVNERGFTVIPCIPLTAENMNDDLIGFAVTIGLSEVGVPTNPGTIEGYTDKHLKIRVGSKVKKLEYNPENIALQVYQFKKMIMFSNIVPRQKDKDEPTASTPKEEKKDESRVEVPVKKKKSSKSRKKSTQPKQQTNDHQAYKPKYGIIWEN